MAPDSSIRSRRTRSGKETRRTGGVRRRTASNVSAAATQRLPENPSDIDALRKARLEYLDKRPEERRKKMKYVGETVAKTTAVRKDVESERKASETRRRHKATTAESQHSHRKTRVTVRRSDDQDREDQFVYRQAQVTETTVEDDSKTRSAETVAAERDAPPRPKTRRKASVDNKQEREERRRPQRRQSEPSRRRNSYSIDNDCASIQRYETTPSDFLLRLTSPELLLLETTLDQHYLEI